MPRTTSFEFGDILLVPFPFTDLRSSKNRPAIVVSSEAYAKDHPDLILIALTSHTRGRTRTGEAALDRWKEAGLKKPSTIKPILFTIEKKLIVKKLGRLDKQDRSRLRDVLDQVLGG